MLKEAGIQTEGLFLNADAGFDSEGFRSLCEEMKIEANIALNPRMENQPMSISMLMNSFLKKGTQLKGLMPGKNASKLYWCALK